jgi:acylphosphatase
MKAVSVVVTGKVQGVYFRDSCRRIARRHAVRGWVRNREDGSVEAVFAGPADAVDAVVDWCHAGPDAAAVESVITEPLVHFDQTDLPDGFEVR